MKKILITLIVAAMMITAASAVSANPDEPVSDEVGAGADEVQNEEAVPEEPIADEGKEEAAEEDYVRPDDDGEIGITSEDGLEVDDAIIYATAINEESSNAGRQPWIYISAGVLVVLFAAALVLRRKSSKA